MKILMLLLLSGAVAMPQTSDSLRRKYGAPISETYLVRPHVQATFSYNGSGKLCLIVIRREEQPSALDNANASLKRYEFMKGIVEELVPSGERGKFISAGFLDASSPEPEDTFRGGYDIYEKITVSTGRRGNRPEETWISWKGVTCPDHPSPISQY